MTPQSFTFAISPFWPIAIGFFGLGTGYFIWGGQALFGYPKASPEVDRTMGLWGFWMPGFCQFLTGVYLIVGLTWFNVFGSAAPDGWMAIAYLFVSVLGAYVFGKAGDVPVMIIFIGLALIYLVEVPTRLAGWNGGSRLVALLQCLTGIWLMYCTWAVTVNLALGYKLWI